MTESYEEGDWRIPDLMVTPYAASGPNTTVATLQLDRDGTLTTVVVTPANDVPEAGSQTWTGEAYELTAGEIIELWVVTGTGKGRERTTLLVAPAPGTLATERVYATTADYADVIGTAPPAGIRRALAEASRMVDEMLLTAVYPVDDGLPTETDHIEALREATCFQVEWAASSGDRNMVGAGRPGNFSLGKLSVTQPRSGSTALQGVGPRGDWSPRAWARLSRAGLTGHAPQSR